MQIDYCCKLEEMASLFVRLAEDDPAAPRSDSLDKLMAIEDRIADGIFNVEDWWNLEQVSSPSGLNCPNCRSGLYELTDKRVLRFRCRSGHAFSARSLLSGQAESRETLLSSLFGAFIEEATLAKRMRRDTAFERDSLVAAELGERVSVLEREVNAVCDWLHSMSGLVEPQ